MFIGTGTALVTPFNDDLSIDLASLKKFVRFQIEGGVDSMVVLGTTGEAPTINESERNKIIETVVDEVNGKVPIIVGTGTNDTKHVVELNRSAEKFNVSGLLIVNPYYNKGTQQSIIEHYQYIAERTSLPILLYNVPSRTGMNVLPETVLKINQLCKNVLGIKEASGDISQIAKLISMKPDDFLLYSGNDDQTLPIMALGGDGIISVASNVFPKEIRELSSVILSNDYSSAKIINNKYLKFMNLLFIESNPIPVKYAVSLLGFAKNTLRLPLIKASEKTMSLIESEMNSLRMTYAEN
jgi:4-hydroxy-tetrahydrodipicolinate synthase